MHIARTAMPNKKLINMLQMTKIVVLAQSSEYSANLDVVLISQGWLRKHLHLLLQGSCTTLRH